MQTEWSNPPYPEFQEIVINKRRPKDCDETATAVLRYGNGPIMAVLRYGNGPNGCEDPVFVTVQYGGRVKAFAPVYQSDNTWLADFQDALLQDDCNLRIDEQGQAVTIGTTDSLVVVLNEWLLCNANTIDYSVRWLLANTDREITKKLWDLDLVTFTPIIRLLGAENSSRELYAGIQRNADDPDITNLVVFADGFAFGLTPGNEIVLINLRKALLRIENHFPETWIPTYLTPREENKFVFYGTRFCFQSNSMNTIPEPIAKLSGNDLLKFRIEESAVDSEKYLQALPADIEKRVRANGRIGPESARSRQNAVTQNGGGTPPDARKVGSSWQCGNCGGHLELESSPPVKKLVTVTESLMADTKQLMRVIELMEPIYRGVRKRLNPQHPLAIEANEVLGEIQEIGSEMEQRNLLSDGEDRD